MNNRTPCSRFCNRCSNPKCQFCPILDTSECITSSYTKCEYESKKSVTCRSSNLVYCITCKTCKKQYVGQTGDSIHKCLGAHFVSIKRLNLKKDVGQHFNLPGHNGIRDVEIAVVDVIHSHPKSTSSDSKLSLIGSRGYEQCF